MRLNRGLLARGIGRGPALRRAKHFVGSALARAFARGGEYKLAVGGYRMLVPEERYLWAYASYEPHSSRLFVELIPPGAVVVDAGACFGYYTLLAAGAVGRSGRVYAFEPLPRNFELLARTVALNGLEDRIVLTRKAVSATNRSVPLHVAPLVENTSLSPPPGATAASPVMVETVALDDALAGRRVDAIKLDVEGHELHALDGMRATIAAARRLVMFCEINVEYLLRAGSPPDRLLARLAELRLTVKLIDEYEHRLLAVTPERLSDIARDPVRYSNLLCTKGVD